MWHNVSVSLRVVTILLWIEHRIGRLRRLVDRPSRPKIPEPAGNYEPFDRRDVRARW